MYGVISAELIRGAAWAARPHPWVARLCGPDSHWGFRREFIKGTYDYSLVRSKTAGRGIMVYWALAPGHYEVYRPVSWNRRSDHRFFIRVEDDGTVVHIEREEVMRCLRSGF